MAHHRNRAAVMRGRDALEATPTADGRLSQGFFARRDILEVRPSSLLQCGILGLRYPGLIGRPFLQARSFRDRELKGIGEEDGALDASPQGACEDRGGAANGPCACQASDLFLSALGERGTVEVRRVRRPENLAVSDEDERRTQRKEPPDTTPITRMRSPSSKDSSTGIGPSPRIKMCASGASRRARNRSRPFAEGPSSTDSSLRPGRISAVTCIRPSRTIRDLSVLSQELSPELLSEPSVSG